MGIAIITINGINNAYENIYGDNIFNDIKLPDGIDLETLVNRIFIRCMEFSVMHSDPDYMHFQILNFFDIHYDTFDKWNKALNTDYDPIENYNRYEDYSGTGSNEGSGTSKGSNSESGSNTLTKSGFNSSSYEPYERNQISNLGNDSREDESNGSYEDSHTSHIHGNIGVTTSQQMLESEIELRRFNIYKAISDMFAEEFCIMVY